MNSVETDPHLRSLERVQTYPEMKDSFLFFLGWYNWAKSKNLGETLKIVKERTEVQVVDETLLDHLDKSETTFPLMLGPSGIESVTQPLGFVIKTSGWAASAITSTLTKLIHTGTLPIKAPNMILDKTEHWLDSYLSEKSDKDDVTEKDYLSDEVMSQKLQRLLEKTRRRLSKKILLEIRRFKEKGLEKLELVRKIIQEIRLRKSSVCKDGSCETREKNRSKELIREALFYWDCVQQVLVSVTKSIAGILCSGSIFTMDLLNQNLVTIRNTILYLSTHSRVCERRLVQAMHGIDFVRSWINSVSNTLNQYYNQRLRTSTKRVTSHPEEDDLPESSISGPTSEEDNYEDDDDDSTET